MHFYASSILSAILAVTSVASKIDDAIKLEKRQSVNLSTGGTSPTSSERPATSTEFTSLAPSTTTFISSGRVTSSGSVIETSSVVIVTPSSSVVVSVSSVTSTITPTNSQGSATAPPTVVTSASSASYQISYSSFLTSITSQAISTYTMTTNGQTIIATRTSNTVVPVTTSARVTGALITASPSSGGSSGLSDSSKKIIGGVVGGVGGALLLGALAFTAWRIWGKKKNLHDDDFYDPNSHPEKLNSSMEAGNNTPFRSTLDQYHQPGPVNTASNF